MTEDRDQGRQPTWRREPMPGLFTGLVLVLLGVTFFLATRDVISWEDWWQYFLIGLGGVFLIQVIVSYAHPAYRRLRFGHLITGVALIAIGLGFLSGFGTWWPLILIIIGLALLLNAWLRRR